MALSKLPSIKEEAGADDDSPLSKFGKVKVIGNKKGFTKGEDILRMSENKECRPVATLSKPFKLGSVKSLTMN
jgi:hypothetical protein